MLYEWCLYWLYQRRSTDGHGRSSVRSLSYFSFPFTRSPCGESSYPYLKAPDNIDQITVIVLGFLFIGISLHIWQYFLFIQGIDMEKTDFMCKFLETKIMQVLRFKHGKVDFTAQFLPKKLKLVLLSSWLPNCCKSWQVYNASVSAFMGGSNPFYYEEMFGHVAVNFSCDPGTPWELVSTSYYTY